MHKQSKLGILLLLTSGLAVLLNVAPAWLQLVCVPIVLIIFTYLSKKDGVSRGAIGLTKSHTKTGVRYGLIVSLIIIVCMVTAFIVAPTLFKDQRYNQGIGGLLFSLLVFLPLRTVLLEEFLFRGVYYAYFSTYPKLQAYLVPSLLFGLWHILPSLSFKSLTIPFLDFVIPQSITTLGTILVTALAGAGLLWLRANSKSLIAPALAHYTLNGAGMVLAYLAFK